jgi:hypothetical protein
MRRGAADRCQRGKLPEAAELLTRDEARRIDREYRKAAGAYFAKLTDAAAGRRLRSFTEFNLPTGLVKRING